MHDCLFCKIASGEIPSKKIYEDSATLAILDINPAAVGHILVIPKKHFENIFDVEEPTLRELIESTQKVAKNLREKLDCDVMILQNNGRAAGQIVSHIHFHVIPRKEGDGIHLTHQRFQMSEEQLEDMRKKLEISKKSGHEEFSRW